MSNRVRVLLVDDDEDEYVLTQELLADRSYLVDGVEAVGFELNWASRYDDALRALQAQAYDVYLVDYHLGEHNGLELVQAAHDQGLDAPIILMTGQGSYALDVEAMNAGATDYLVKGEVNAPLLERTLRYAIDRKRIEAEIRRHADEAEMLAQLSQSFAAASREYPQVLAVIAQQTALATGNGCVLHLLSEDREWLEPVAYYHPNEAIQQALQAALEKQPLAASHTPAGDILEQGRAVLLAQPATLSLVHLRGDLPSEDTFHGALIAPLRMEGRPTGLLTLLLTRPAGPFTPQDQVFIQELADRAALAIDNARLYRAQIQRARELDALHSATAALLGTLDVETLLGQILDAAQSAIPATEKGILYLLAADTGQLQVRATSGYQDPRIRRVTFPRGTDYPARAVQERRPFLVQDTLAEKKGASPSVPQGMRPIRSAVVAPLLLGQQILGVLTLNSSQPGAFNDSDLRLLMSFATTTTAALQNAMLHGEVQKLAISDSLTDLYNRRGFFDLGHREIERSRRFGRPLSAIMIDLDRFKLVNDTFGHAAGDVVLQILAERIRSATREVDILGRYGGDEFVVLLPEADLFTACTVAERIRTRVEEPIMLPTAFEAQSPVQITVSIGVAHAIAETIDLNALLERADQAAYQAKHKGRNRVEVG